MLNDHKFGDRPKKVLIVIAYYIVYKFNNILHECIFS